MAAKTSSTIKEATISRTTLTDPRDHMDITVTRTWHSSEVETSTIVLLATSITVAREITKGVEATSTENMGVVKVAAVILTRQNLEDITMITISQEVVNVKTTIEVTASKSPQTQCAIEAATGKSLSLETLTTEVPQVIRCAIGIRAIQITNKDSSHIIEKAAAGIPFSEEGAEAIRTLAVKLDLHLPDIGPDLDQPHRPVEATLRGAMAGNLAAETHLIDVVLVVPPQIVSQQVPSLSNTTLLRKNKFGFQKVTITTPTILTTLVGLTEAQVVEAPTIRVLIKAEKAEITRLLQTGLQSGDLLKIEKVVEVNPHRGLRMKEMIVGSNEGPLVLKIDKV